MHVITGLQPGMECAICGKQCGEEPIAKLTQKGSATVNRCSEARGSNVRTEIGQTVHTDCRKQFTDPRIIAAHQNNLYTSDAPANRFLRSKSGVFKTQCLFCGLPAKYDGKKRGYDVIPVKSKSSFQSSILKVCDERNDEWANTVAGRIAVIDKICSWDAVYHEMCSVSFRTGRQLPKRHSPKCTDMGKRGRPEVQELRQAFLEVVSYLEDTDDEQITIKDLVVKMEEILHGTDLKPYSVPYMKSKLVEHFKDSIIITEINGKQNVVTLRKTAEWLLHDFYGKQRQMNAKEDAERIIETAAELIKADIKSMVTSADSSVYPSTDDFKIDAALKYVPDSLLLFLRHLFAGKDNELKLASIAQAIMQATMPRVILAPLQLGLAVQVHDHFASRFIVDSLHQHGFACSYSEVLKFERSSAISQGTDLAPPESGQFVQYIADNVDHNVRSLDGFNTFHGMGMIASFTPGTLKAKPVPRITVSSRDLIQVGRINIRYLTSHRTKAPHLVYHELKAMEVSDPTAHIDILWEMSFCIHPNRPAWSGLMQTVHKGEYPGQSAIHFLPMIDMNPTDVNCVYSTLWFVCSQAKRYNITPVLTFDQPLWYKAMMIVESEPTSSILKTTVLKLGGFHTEMSFVGSIGHLMACSGLKEVFELVYAENTVKHMLCGKAISRAVRAHLMVDAALRAIVVSKAFNVELTAIHDPLADPIFEDSDLNESKSLFKRVIENDPDVLTDAYCIELTERITVRLQEFRESLKEARTAQIWFQYLDMIKILKQFIKAERTGDWNLHLASVRQMLPYFAASGHNLYAKSAYLYLQKMDELQNTHPEVYNSFQNGLHVIRRSDRYWAGLSPDLVIEQVLMRSVKASGGLTRGRGMSEIQRTVWVLSMPARAEVNFAMQDLTGVRYQTSEQHRENSQARQQRDIKDTAEILNIFTLHDPFGSDSTLHNIISGVVAGEEVNVDEAKSTGNVIIKSLTGKSVHDFVFKKSNQSITMGSKTGVSTKEDNFQVDPQHLFQRLCLVASTISLDDQKSYFEYELSNHPTSLFDDSGLPREANKPALANEMWSQSKQEEVVSEIPDGAQYVIDGGALLQRIPWQRNALIEDICDSYAKYVISRYGRACIIFDGYDDGPSIKDATHRRRAGGAVGPNVIFNNKTVIKLKKQEFLANKINKQRFIFILGEVLQKSGCHIEHAKEDADLQIVKAAIESAGKKDTVLVGDDTDLLVLLVYHTPLDAHRILFKAEPKSNYFKRPKLWDIQKAKQALGPDVCNNILFIHAILGCDSVSRVHGIGKGAALKKIKSRHFLEQAAIFCRDGDFKKEALIEAGEKALVCLYNGNKKENLDILRYKRFREKVSSSSRLVEAKSLPPTSAASKFHSLRVWYQIQVWKDKGREHNPEEWGWLIENGQLMPVKTDRPPAPEKLLLVSKCNCRSGCNTQRCSCKKHNIECSSLCGHCKGLTCSNSPVPDFVLDEDDEYPEY